MIKGLRLVTCLSLVLLASAMSANGNERSLLSEHKDIIVSTPIRFPKIGKTSQEKIGEGIAPDVLSEATPRPPEKQVISYAQGENLAVVGMYLFNNFAAEDGLFIVGGVKNTGTSTQNEVMVQFFLGDPDSQGTQIGGDIVIPSIPTGSTVYDSVSWSGFTGSSHIYCLVDPCDSVAEENEVDNLDSLTVGMVDAVPWVWQAINGFCNYAGLAMMYNFYGADHDVYEVVELACCPYSMLYVDDWLTLYAGWIVCQSTDDYEFAGLIRNLTEDIQVEESWTAYLAALKATIDAGVPFETSVDPYYLPQPDYDIARIYNLHSGHAIVVTGYTDEAIIFNDPGVGLDIGDEPGLPHPENRGKNVVIHVDSFRNAVEQSLGTSYILISYTPSGPMPTEQGILQAAVEKSILRLTGDQNAFDPGWGQLFDVFGGTSFASLMEDMNLETFQAIFNEVMVSVGGNLAEALGIMAQRCDLWGCQICWEGSARYYGSLSYPEATALRDLSAQLSSLGEDLWTTYYDMLEAIYSAAGNLSVAEPYFSQMQSDLDQIIVLEDSVLVNLMSLYGYITGAEETEITQGQIPNFQLACYPNPFNQRAAIRYALPKSGDMHVAIYNLLGQRVRMLWDARQTAGRHEVIWDGKDEGGWEVASGLYFCRIEAGGLSRTVKMVLVK
jgi:flagellar hook assembly protein FlgD